jgi:hypothetical protein
MHEPRPLLMWAAIVPTQRGAYIVPSPISSTRRDAAKAYRNLWSPEHQATIIKRHGVTFRRVIVAVQEEA